MVRSFFPSLFSFASLCPILDTEGCLPYSQPLIIRIVLSTEQIHIKGHMNLTIAKEQLINGLQAVQNVVSIRTTLPILSNVLIRAEKDRVELTATDLDVTISCTVEASVKKAEPPRCR